jgi:O-antigen/teichoic acid export membrane protein
MSTRRKIALNVFYLASSQGMAWILNSLYIIVVPRYLGPSGIGTLTLVGAVAAILNSFALMGTSLYLLREVARGSEKSGLLIGANLVLSTILCVIAWVGAIIVFNILDVDESTRQVVYITAVVSVLGVSIAPLQTVLQGLDKMQYQFITTFFNKGLRTGLAISFALLHLGLVMVAAVDLFWSVPLVWLYIMWFNKHSKATFTSDPLIYKELIKGSLPFLVYEICLNIYLQLDHLLLAGMVSQEMVGYYGVAFRLMATFTLVPQVLGNAILPTLSRMAVDTSDGKMHDTSRKLLVFTLCLSLPISVGCTVIAEPFILLFYGDKFTQTIPILIILGWLLAPTYLGIGLYQVLVAQNKQTLWVKVLIAGTILNLSLNLVLIQVFQANIGNGGIGAALSLFLTELFIASCGLVMVGREISNRELAVNMLKSLGAAALMGGLIWPLRETFILIPVLAGVIIYGVGVVAFGLIPLRQVRLASRTAFGMAGRLKQRLMGAK